MRPTDLGSTGEPRRWECVRCPAVNAASAMFCERCGALSPSIEEELLVAEEYVVLDGVRALTKGGEETARRCFVVATASNPQSEHAWFWRARTALTIEELVRSLELCLQLNPQNERAHAALEQAKRRRDLEAGEARALGKALMASARPRRRLQLPKRTGQVSMDLASVACVGLSVLWLGPLIAPALAAAGVRMPDGVIPSFANAPPELPAWIAGSPPLPQLSELVASARLDLLPHPWRIAAALAYLFAAFYAASGEWGGRALVIVAGLAAVALIPFASAVGPAYLSAAVAALGLGVLGSSIRLPVGTPGALPGRPRRSILATLRGRSPRSA